MAKNIEPRLKKIGEYLKLNRDTVFEIPAYQRAYSWDIARCDKLWQDIQNFADTNYSDSYFFGTIIINCKDEDKKYVLIDGQQRTTSFLLLLKALLIKINEEIGKTPADQDSEKLLRGLRDRRREIMTILYKADKDDVSDYPNEDEDKALFNSKILENLSINENDSYKNELQTILRAYSFDEAKNNVVRIKYKQKDNVYTNFFKNFKFFYEKAKSTLSTPQLNKFTKCILDNCEIIEIKSWQVDQAITMFNSLNSDGMPLFDSDILSAKFLAKAESVGQGTEFQTLWKTLLETINLPNNSEIINIDSILMQYMYSIRASRKETISEAGKAIVTTPGVRRYFEEGDGKNTKEVIIEHPIESCQQMLYIVKIWNSVAENTALKVLLKFNDNVKLFLGCYFYRLNGIAPSSDEITMLAETLLRLFTVLELVDAGYSSSNFKSFLFIESVRLVDKTVPLERIKEDFTQHIRKIWSENDLRGEILDYDKNALVYLNEYLFAKENNIPFQFSEKYDIEHIMPYSGTNLQVIRKDAEIANEEDFKNIVNKLGNKILLEVKINRSIGNEWFSTKVSTNLKDKTGYIDSVYPLATSLVSQYKDNNKPYWKKTDILTATEKASNRILKFIFD